MSEVPILKDTTRSKGRDALRNNITAAMALAGAVRSTLGPLGLDKLLVDDEGRTIVTNDGVTVLESAKVEHPVAQLLINASTTQDKIARDGTTSAVILSAELLQNAWYLTQQGIHPSTIARGYRMAHDFTRNHLNSLSVGADDQRILQATTTALAGKLHREMQQHLSKLAFEAGKAIRTTNEIGAIKADPTRVKVMTSTGGVMTDSHLITGLVLPKKRVSTDMQKSIGAGKIALIDGGIERKELMHDVKLNVTSTGVLESFRLKEKELLNKEIMHLKSLGVNLLACKEGVDDDLHDALVEAGIQTYRRVARSDLDLLSRGTGATLVLQAKHVTTEDLGSFISSKNVLQGGTMHWIVETEDGGATFVAKGATNDVVGEVERCFADALGVACQLLEEPHLLAGGGATHIALARALRTYAHSIPGREQLAIEAYADAIEVIPRTLAENSGLDPIDTILNIGALQSTTDDEIAHFFGMDIVSRKPANMVEIGVVEPMRITRQVISGATDAAISVLRIDDVLWAKQEATIPDGMLEDED